MDDEANIRIALIVVVGMLALACALVFGLGVARENVPITTTQGQEQAVKEGLAACKNLPLANRATCINGVAAGMVDAPIREAALNDCTGITVTVEEEQCLTAVSAGTDLGGSPQEDIATAIIACDRIGTFPDQSKSDSAADVARCVSSAMGKPVVTTSTKKKKK